MINYNYCSFIFNLIQDGELFTGSEISKTIGTATSNAIVEHYGYQAVFVQCGDTPGHDVYLKKGAQILYKLVRTSYRAVYY